MASPEPEAERASEPDAEPTSHVVKAPSALSRFGRWARPHWGVLVAVGAPLITVLTIVIPLIADAGVKLSSAETLRVETADGTSPVLAAGPSDDGGAAAAVAAGVEGLNSAETLAHPASDGGYDRGWRVRSDAPWEQFPASEPGQQYGCSAAQIAWLEQWGRRTVNEVWDGYLTLSNTANDGASMSLANLRSVGEFIVPEVPEVSVICGGGIGGGEDIIIVRHELNSPMPAVFGAQHESMPEGTPAVVNIAPGQFVHMLAYFTRPAGLEHADFRGDFVAEVTAGGTTTTVTLFEGFTRVAPPEIQSVELWVNGDRMDCGYQACTIGEFVEMLHADPGFTR